MTSTGPKWIELLSDEAQALSQGTSSVESPLGKSDLMAFLESAINDVLERRFKRKITGFTQDDRDLASDLEEQLDEETPGDEYIGGILQGYEDLCDLWPDILALEYGGEPSDFRSVRTEVAPDIIEQLAWYYDEIDPDVYQLLVRAKRSYSDALNSAEREEDDE